MKKLYSFQLNNPIEIDETITKLDENQKEIRVVEKVKKDNYLSYFVATPTISVNQEAELFYESIVAECIKKGIMSLIQLRKRFLNDGGVLSEEQKEEYHKFWDKLFELKAEFNTFNQKPEENKAKLDELTSQTTDILLKLQDFEERNGSTTMYNHTAENIASNRTVIWLTLYLSYQEKNGKNIPVFGNGSYQDRIKKYEEMEISDNPYDYELLEKLLTIVNLFYFQKAKTKEQFDSMMQIKERKEEIEAEEDKNTKVE